MKKSQKLFGGLVQKFLQNEIDEVLAAEKHERTDKRAGYRQLPETCTCGVETNEEWLVRQYLDMKILNDLAQKRKEKKLREKK